MVDILITSNSQQFAIFPDISLYCPVLPCISLYFPVFPGISQYFPAFPSISQYFPAFPAIPGDKSISRLFNNPVL